MRPIDADALAELLKREAEHHELDGLLERSYGVLDAYMDVLGAPTIDAVPVVQCKDCKRVYCRTYRNWQEPIYTCTHFRNIWNTDYDLEVNPDGFCSMGERREEDAVD